MPNYQTSAWQKLVLQLVNHMLQQGLWGHMDMLHQNMLPRVSKASVLLKLDALILVKLKTKIVGILTGHLYVKSDVYGFGVVLVEMLTGMRALDTNRPSAQHNLVEWVKPHLSDKRKLKNIMDSRLEGKYPSRGAVLIAQLALTCLAPEQKTRPSMKEVVERLEGVEAVNEKPRPPRVHSSQHLSSRNAQSYRSPHHPRQDRNRLHKLPTR